MTISYKDAGVDIAKGNEAVERMRKHVASTYTPGVLTDIGNFAGLFAIDTKAFPEPVLVSGTDGVGTKLKIAMMMDRHDTIGIDAVAMCVNDILVQGATPLFFLDYLAVGKLEPEQVAQIVKGVAAGCRDAGAALIGGETAEMPDFYDPGEYDIAGFAVGIVNRPDIVDGSKTDVGDVILALPSAGLHSNGFSLVRRLVFGEAKLAIDAEVPELGGTLGEELLRPTRIYVKDILPLLKAYPIKAMSHITGGGLIENLPRTFSKHLSAKVDVNWQIPPVFPFLQKIGNVAAEEMFRVFNMGIGFVLIVDGDTAEAMLTAYPELMRIGQLVEGGRQNDHQRSKRMMRIVVLASGRGSNFQAILNRVQNGDLPLEIAALISDNAKAKAWRSLPKQGSKRSHWLMIPLLMGKNIRKRFWIPFVDWLRIILCWPAICGFWTRRWWTLFRAGF